MNTTVVIKWRMDKGMGRKEKGEKKEEYRGRREWNNERGRERWRE